MFATSPVVPFKNLKVTFGSFIHEKLTLNTDNHAVSFFIKQSGTINMNFSVYFLINEYSYNGLNNRSEYIKNGSILKISTQKLENYSQYQEVLLGFNIDNGTLLQRYRLLGH